MVWWILAALAALLGYLIVLGVDRFNKKVEDSLDWEEQSDEEQAQSLKEWNDHDNKV